MAGRGLYRDEGVVLRTVKLGESDRIVTVFTLGHGKIRAVAKGVRKPGSRFGARLEPTSHVEIQCYVGRNLDVVTQVESVESLRALREHYGALTHSLSMLEAVDHVTMDREPNAALFRMLVGALRTMADRPSSVVASAFFWKLLSLEGFHPVLDRCVRCGTASSRDTGIELIAYLQEEGGALCESCGRLAGERVSSEALAMIRRILGGELKAVLDEGPGEHTLEVERLAVGAFEYHMERRLRSAALLR